MNTSAPLFTEQNLSKETEKNLAEMYSRMYALAAEDFTTTQDIDTYIKALTEWMRALQQQLTTLSNTLSSHRHQVPPHTHPIEPHTHPSPAGGLTGPNSMGLITSPTPLETNVPMETGNIRWNEIQPPQYVNTTNAVPNKTGNMVITGPTMVGPFETVERRAKTPQALLQPTVLPLVKNLAKV